MYIYDVILNNFDVDDNKILLVEKFQIESMSKL